MTGLRAVVEDTNVSTRSGISKTTGKAYEIRSQEALFHYGRGESVRLSVNLEVGQEPYGIGTYELDAACFRVGGQYGDLMLGRGLRLVRMETLRPNGLRPTAEMPK